MLKYEKISNLDFDEEINSDKLREVKEIIFSINNITHVSFKEKTSVSDIECVKCLLESSPTIDDKRVEKLILRNNTPEELKEILAMNLDNPNSWHLAYKIDNDTYSMTSIPNFRLMEEYIDVVLSCVREDMSPLEKIKEVYDFVKLLDSDEERFRLPDVIRLRSGDSFDFQMLMQEILNRIGIKTYIGEVKREDNEYITIIDINDDKYKASGIYFFDPYSDSIPKKTYKNEVFRKVNYNYFGRSLKEINATKDKLIGILGILNTDSIDYVKRKIDDKESEKLEGIFGCKIDDLYNRIQKTKEIDIDNILSLIINNVHQEDFVGLNRDYKELLTNNYRLREEELFIKEDKKIEMINIHDV